MSFAHEWNGWETVEEIGQGSFGVVYKIERDLFGNKEDAALKVLSIPDPRQLEEWRDEGYDEDSITERINCDVEKIVKEYAIMKTLSGNTNIVNCSEIDVRQKKSGEGYDVYIKMELLTPLTKYLRANAITEEMVVKIGRDLCKALILCEKNQIVHRDIKPENILISRYGDFKLGDFGIAKNIERTMGGTKIGTYKFMAPEVYNNEPYSYSVDLYSLGLVMYWMLNSRRMPFIRSNSAADAEESRYRRLTGEKIPEPMNGSDGLKKIILKACEYNKEDRFASAEEMLAALNDLVFGKDSGESISSETDGDEDPENTLPPPGVDELVDLPLESEKPALEPEVKKNVFEKGEYVKLGTFYDDTSKEEVSLEWKVLDVADGKALLFLDEAVPFSRRKFSDSPLNNDWKESEIRAWLNKQFIISSFSKKEFMAIEETKVTADNNPAFFDDTSFAADTVDQVFLLSIAECIQYFKNWYDEECGKRKFHITEYFRKTEYDNSENSSTPWWLRTQGKDSNVSYVDSKGKVNVEGSPANVQTMAIRPAMWVNISALQD